MLIRTLNQAIVYHLVDQLVKIQRLVYVIFWFVTKAVYVRKASSRTRWENVSQPINVNHNVRF